MAQSQLRKQLQEKYELLKTTFLEIEDAQYTDIVFDLYTIDSYMAGIADSILNNEQISREEKERIKHPLVENNILSMPCTSNRYDLKKFEKAVEYVQLLAEIREICAKIIEENNPIDK